MSRFGLPRDYSGTVLANTLERYQACLFLRGTFLMMGEPFEEEVDQHDHCAATHLLHLQNQEPVGTMRIRFLHGTTCGWQRVVIRQDLWARESTTSEPEVAIRTGRVAPALIADAKRYCERKGMTEAVGAVNNEAFQKLLRRKGAEFVESGDLTYGSKLYRAMRIPLAPEPAPKLNLESVREEWYLERPREGDEGSIRLVGAGGVGGGAG